MTTGRINQVSAPAMHLQRCTASHHLCFNPHARQTSHSQFQCLSSPHLHIQPFSCTFNALPSIVWDPDYTTTQGYWSAQPHPLRCIVTRALPLSHRRAPAQPVPEWPAPAPGAGAPPYIVLSRPAGGLRAVWKHIRGYKKNTLEMQLSFILMLSKRSIVKSLCPKPFKNRF